MRFEIRYFFKKKVSNFKPHYILPLPNGMVAHALSYWPNVGAFGPSLPQPPNLTSLRKLRLCPRIGIAGIPPPKSVRIEFVQIDSVLYMRI